MAGNMTAEITIGHELSNKLTNVAGQRTPVLSFKIPRGIVATLRKDDGFNLYLPTREKFTHDGTGDNTFSLSYGIEDSAKLSDGRTAKAWTIDGNGDPDTETTVASINYSGNEVTVNHNTNEDVYVYYYPAEGSCWITAYNPKGSGVNSKDIFASSISYIHTIAQDADKSRLELGTSWQMLQAQVLKIEVKADWTVQWDGGLGQVFIPFDKISMRKITKEQAQRINKLYVM